jgi:hypothetical protein
MQENEKILIKMLNMLLDNSNLISLNTKIDLEANLISVRFSVLCDENAIVENSHKMQKRTQEIIEDKTFKEILTSGFSKKEIERLKEQYTPYQIEKGICGSSHWPKSR